MSDRSQSVDLEQARSIVDKMNPEQLAQATAAVQQLERQFVEQVSKNEPEVAGHLFGADAERGAFEQQAQGRAGEGEQQPAISLIILTIRIKC